MSFEIEFTDDAHEGVPLDISATVNFDGEDFYIEDLGVHTLDKDTPHPSRGYDITELLSPGVLDNIENEVYRRADEYAMESTGT